MTVIHPRTAKYIFIFIIIWLCRTQLGAGATDSTGVVFPLQVNWLADKYVSTDRAVPQGMHLITENYMTLNRHLFPVSFPGLRKQTHTDKDNKYIIFQESLAEQDFRIPRVLSIDYYYQQRKRNYLHDKLVELTVKESLQQGQQKSGGKIELISADIAGQRVALQVSGNVNINGRLQNQERSQVAAGYREGKTTSFIVDQKQQLNIEGKIGDRISILVDQDSERDFDFENNLRIHYTGEEDEIVQGVQAGNISLSLPGTQYVTFSSKSSGLFGIKSDMKLGGMDITAIASVEKGEKQKLSVDGGAQSTENSVQDYEYQRNLYFFLDSTYRANLYRGFFENGGRFTFDPNRIVSDLEVYKSVIIEAAGTMYGKAFVDPNDTTRYREQTEQRLFERLTPEQDYTFNNNLGYIRLNTQLQSNEVLAVAYRTVYVDNNDKKQTVQGFGQWDREPTDTTKINLKLIKPQNMLPDDPTWPLMFKNVYYLGATNINPDGFECKIVYIHGRSGDEERDKQDGETFLYKFGLDEMDESGNLSPDDQLDVNNPAVIDLQRGELWIPFLHPFEYGNDELGEKNPRLSDDYSCPKMYNLSFHNNQNEISEDSKFKVTYKYENRSSIINLGPMVIDGSESVTLNGTQLTKGVDYTIDYFSGTLTLLKDDATNPDANLDIKYEKNQFFQLDKKTILGARAQYDFGANNFIGATALYYSKSVIDEKVDVGYEPMRNFVWDVNGRYDKELNFLTRAINKLPLVQTDRPSSFSLEGEIARVNPNPNTISNEATGDSHGVGFIDDFEGAKRVTSPPIMRRYWTQSAVPLGKTDWQRGHINWFNPYGGVPTNSIWPNKETSTKAQNTITEIMILRMNPAWARGLGKNATSSQKKEAWGGVTYFLPASYRDQSKSKFLEIWVRGDSGLLHIDLGQISEDQIADGQPNTEDRPEEGSGMKFGNGLLEDGEDTGLDGVFDTEETVIVRDPYSEIIDTLGYGDNRLKTYARDPEDPNSDNWWWENGSTDYTKINGTENSKRDVAGRFPDTEDMNGNYVLDKTNDYVTVEFPLSEKDHEYIAGRTENQSGNDTGWKLYRIPLTEFDAVKTDPSFSWESIEACRIWMDGVTQKSALEIAKIEIVGNEWQEMGIAQDDSSTYREAKETFAVTVVNTEDNPDIYDSPTGVQGEYDRINEIRAKEQSLVLKIYSPRGLKYQELCAAEKDLLEETSFITYKEMKLFINGHDIRNPSTQYKEGDKTPLSFFIRFGRGGNNPQFYEYRQPVYMGWDKHNQMTIDLDFLTGLKAYTHATDFPTRNEEGLQEFWIERDSTNAIQKRIYKEVKEGEYTGKEIIIHGSPAISRIMRLEMGLKNRGAETVYGEVWLDELRLSEVRRDPGVAYRSRMQFKLADVANFNVNISRQDADFHRVEEKPSMNTRQLNTSNRMDVRGNLNLHKFTPSKWGLNIPVSASYSENKSIPKYLPGSDILTGDSPPDSIMSINHSYGVNTSFSKSRSDFWLTRYTLDEIRIGLNAKRTQSSNVETRTRKATTYAGNLSYEVPFGRDNYLEIFKWMEPVPVLGEKFSALRWYYTPNQLSYSMNASESRTRNVPRWGEIKENYSLGMSQKLNLGYKMFDNLNLSYTRNLKNDMNEMQGRKAEILSDLSFGTPINIQENYNLTYNPKIFSWFNPSINYGSNYTWSESVNSTTVSVDQISNQNRFSTSFGLNLSQILDSFYSPATSSSSGSSRGRTGSRTGNRTSEYQRGRRTTPDKDQEEPELEKEQPKKEFQLLKTVSDYLAKIQTIQCSFSLNQTVNSRYRTGEPGMSYRLGFDPDPHLPVVAEEAGVGKDNVSQNLDFSLRSGLNITSNLNTSFNFAQNVSVSERQGEKSRNFNRDFLPVGQTGRDGIPFPGWSVRWSGLEKIAILSTVFQSLSLDHGFSGKEARTMRNGKEQQSSYKMYFQPLIGLSMRFKKDINANMRVTHGQTINNRSSGTAIITEQNITTSINYKRKGGITIPLPFMENKHLENNIDFQMSFDYSNAETRERNKGGGKFSVTNKNSHWKVAPRINYSFTKKVTGGIFFQYGVSRSKQTGKRTTRDGGFDVNIAIRG